jgi:hypothetical protein
MEGDILWMRSASSGCGQGVASTEGWASSARSLVASSSSSMCSTSARGLILHEVS